MVQADDCVYMKTVSGLERVDVIYRRIDDLFWTRKPLIPIRFWCARFNARVEKGNGACQCPGAGVADDKVIYAFVPKIIKYYLIKIQLFPM